MSRIRIRAVSVIAATAVSVMVLGVTAPASSVAGPGRTSKAILKAIL